MKHGIQFPGRLLTAFFLLTCGCSNHTPSSSTDGDDTNTDIDLLTDSDTTDSTMDDPTAKLFARDHVLEISIAMAPEHWDELRMQTRSVFDVIGTNCQSSPPEDPFTYFPANITIDGDFIQTVGVRKKGFYGSLSEDKPSLKVKFSEYNEEQTYSGEERLTLNNSISDPSYIKQCVGYDVFSQAGIPAPRCNFAHVSVNDADLGLYVNVESIKKRFLRRHFADDEGHLYEGALSDFRSGWVDTFQVKTNKDDEDRTDLLTLTENLENPEGDVAVRISDMVNINAFVRYWAAEFLIMHADGYARNTNNFYLYNDPSTGTFQFIPWGIDAVMNGDMTLPWETVRPEGAVWAEGILSRRLYNDPTYQNEYFETLAQLLDTVWDEEAILQKIDDFAALIRPYVFQEEKGNFDLTLGLTKGFVMTRRENITSLLPLRPQYSSELRAPMCSAPIGTITGTFDTTFGTLDSPTPFAEGAATLSLTLNGETIPFIATSSLSGINDEGSPAVRFVAAVSETEIWVVEMGQINDARFTSNTDIPIDWVDSVGILLRIFIGQSDEFEVMGIVGDGILTLVEAAAVEGNAIRGEFTGNVYKAPF